jgi:hypothetical protein
MDASGNRSVFLMPLGPSVLPSLVRTAFHHFANVPL